MIIKIGRKEYTMMKGNYILYNGACHQLCTHDGRVLKQDGFNSYCNLRIPETQLKKIDLTKLEKVEYLSSGMKLTKYILS